MFAGYIISLEISYIWSCWRLPGLYLTRSFMRLCIMPLFDSCIKRGTLILQMEKFNQAAINYVLKTGPGTRAKVLFKFLVEGKSHRQIERETMELSESNGFNSWKVTQFFGFGDKAKGTFSGYTFKDVLSSLENVDMGQFKDYHLENIFKDKRTEMSESAGTDLLRSIKTRVGQARVRKEILFNYQNKCALCDIDTDILLVASHIKPWSISTQKERIDPSNVVLLCRLHDGLFENGYICLDDNFKVLYRDPAELDRQGISTELAFRMPISGSPSILYIKEHRSKHKLVINK